MKKKNVSEMLLAPLLVRIHIAIRNLFVVLCVTLLCASLLYIPLLAGTSRGSTALAATVQPSQSSCSVPVTEAAAVGFVGTSIRDTIVDNALSQVGQHYLWGTEGDVPDDSEGEVKMSDWDHVAETTHYTMKKGSPMYCAGRFDRLSTNETVYPRPLCLSPPKKYDPGKEVYGADCEGIRHFDCSGFVYYVYEISGVSMVRANASKYFEMCKKISRAQLEKGDLVLLGSPIHHVGIFAGSYIIEAREAAYGVVAERTVDKLQQEGTVQFGSLWAVQLECLDDRREVLPGGSTTYDIEVTNEGGVTDTISLERSELPSGWTASLSTTSVTLHGKPASTDERTTTIHLTITAPVDAREGDSATITVKATSSGDTISDVTSKEVNVKCEVVEHRFICSLKIPLYPGAKNVTSAVKNMSPGIQWFLVGDVRADTVQSWYDSKMTEEGWTKVGHVGWVKSDSAVQIYIHSFDTERHVTTSIWIFCVGEGRIVETPLTQSVRVLTALRDFILTNLPFVMAISIITAAVTTVVYIVRKSLRVRVE